MTRSVALVTGGSRGIGAATVRALARAGMGVCLTYRQDRESADRLCDELADVAPCVAVRVDITDGRSTEQAFDVAETLGRVALLVNSAGVTHRIGRLETWTPADLATVLDVNLLGSLLACRAAVQRWSNDPAGRCIVNVSSAAATTGAPREYVAYAAAKAGVDALTVGLAKEVAHLGIRVNAVAPGTTDTGIHAAAGDPGRAARVASVVPMGRVATPDEVASAITWLASGSASYVSGAVLRVTGAA